MGRQMDKVSYKQMFRDLKKRKKLKRKKET